MRKTTLPLLAALLSLILSSCFNINSESSCKSLLCDGFWSYEYQAEPLISKNGNFIFNKNGTVIYATVGKQINGTWSLGEVQKLTEKLSKRIINVSMESDISMGVGSTFIMKLDKLDKKSSISFESGSTYYSHFNDNSKPID